MVTFNNRINNNRPHKYQKSATGDRDANAQNAYRQQAQKEDDSQQSQPDTEEDLNKTISFLDKKEKVIIKNLENSSVIDPNLSLNKELKDLITRINIKSQDKVNSEYLNDLLCDFSKIKDNKIMYSLSAVKGVGIESMKELVLERNTNGLFKSISDFNFIFSSRMLCAL